MIFLISECACESYGQVQLDFQYYTGYSESESASCLLPSEGYSVICKIYIPNIEASEFICVCPS